MKKWLSCQVGVDQCRHNTNFRAPQPEADKFDPIFHEQGNTLTGFVTFSKEEVSHTIAILLKFLETPSFILVYQSCLLGMPLDSPSKRLRNRQVKLLIVIN